MGRNVTEVLFKNGVKTYNAISKMTNVINVGQDVKMEIRENKGNKKTEVVSGTVIQKNNSFFTVKMANLGGYKESFSYTQLRLGEVKIIS